MTEFAGEKKNVQFYILLVLSI